MLLAPIVVFGSAQVRPGASTNTVSSFSATAAHSFSTALHRCDPVFSGAGPLVAAGLWLALVLLVPRAERWKAKAPLLALLAALALMALDAAIPERVLGRNFHRFTAQFLLLASVGRSGFVVLVDVLWSQRRARPLPKILRDVMQGLVFALVGLLVLRAAGVEPGSLLTTSALLTAVLGLSLQDTLGNLFAGLAIQAQQPFEVGDWIQFDEHPDHIGRVLEINWRATRILTLTQVEITIPNALAAKAPLVNYSRPNQVVRQDVKVVGPLEVSPDKARQWMLQALRHTPFILASPEPHVVTVDYDERGVIYEVRFFITAFDLREIIKGDVRERIWYALHREGYEIPVPGRRIEVINKSEREPKESTDSADYRYRLLSRLELFQGLTQEEIQTLAQHCRHQAYGHEELIVRQGDRTSEMFIVERGQVRIEADLQGSDKPHLISTLDRGDFFGEMSLLTGEARVANVVATEETEVLVLTRETFAPIIEANPTLADRISRVLTERRKRLNEAAGASAAPAVPAAEQAELLKRIRRFFSL
jgi:small-conductance mechanosensitive channel/CRP-like cAMP-binding protein